MIYFGFRGQHAEAVEACKRDWGLYRVGRVHDLRAEMRKLNRFESLRTGCERDLRGAEALMCTCMHSHHVK